MKIFLLFVIAIGICCASYIFVIGIVKNMHIATAIGATLFVLNTVNLIKEIFNP